MIELPLMSKNTSLSFSDRNIIISAHVNLTGFTDHMEELLAENKIHRLLVIAHPLHVKRNKTVSQYKLYKKGFVKKIGTVSVANSIVVINFIKAVFLNIKWGISSRENWDLFFGSNNLNAFSGILLRRLGYVRKVVFYSVDFVPVRFKNILLNTIYHWIEKYAVIHADETWVLSPRVIEGRKKLLRLSQKYDKKQFVVPEGIWLKRTKKNNINHVDKNAAIFVGHIEKRMGLQYVIRALPKIQKRVPGFKLYIVGRGPYLEEIKKLIQSIGVERSVIVKGYVKDYGEVEELVASCGIGVATYTIDPSGLTYYADPAKAKLYLGAGIPVIITNEFYYAHDIEDAGAGKVVKTNSQSISNAILEIISSIESFQLYRKRARAYAKQFDFQNILIPNLERVFSK